MSFNPSSTPRLRLVLTFFFCLLAFCAANIVDGEKPALQRKLSLAEIDEGLQECTIVQRLNSQKLAEAAAATGDGGAGESSLTKRVFAVLFPAGPAVNSILATAYISGPPNLILALVPANIDPSSLSIMVAFAVGGLLGDTLLHLIPQTFMGEPLDHDKAHFVLLDPKRNALLGLFIFVGFVTFVGMDKTMRILSGGDAAGGGGHGHSHGAGHEHSNATVASGVETGSGGELKKRGAGKKEKEKEDQGEKKEVSNSVKPSSYLNLVADFSHNITDGLAMSAAFYAGPTVGATTTVAVFFHEIPHEVGDFALLVQSGFTKWQAMGAQFFTAVGAFLGTFIGIAIQHFSSSSSSEAELAAANAGIWDTGLTAGDLVLPFTAGTFLYVGFSVIPELLETGPDKAFEVRKALTQAVAMAAGFGIMLVIS